MNTFLMLLSCGCGIISIIQFFTTKNQAKTEAQSDILFFVAFALAYAAAWA